MLYNFIIMTYVIILSPILITTNFFSQTINNNSSTSYAISSLKNI